MKLDVALPIDGKPLPRIAELARGAEALGFAAMWSSETSHDAFLPLAIAAEHTSRFQLGTAVAIAFARSPMDTAQTAWDLQDFSNGRLLLGLGTQVKAHIERRFGMPWEAPVRRLRDYIGALRAIRHSFQSGEPLNYRGQFYKHTLLTPFFNPGPVAAPNIPIAIAGVNPGLARLAGELCQGFHVHPFHSPRYIDEIVRPALATGADTAGRDAQQVELSTSVFVLDVSTADIETQRQRLREQLAFYASTPTYRVVLDVHGWGEVGEQLGRIARAQRWRDMPRLVSDEMLAAFGVSAAPDKLGTVLRERYRGRIDRLALYLPFEPGQNEAFWQTTLRAIAGAA